MSFTRPSPPGSAKTSSLSSLALALAAAALGALSAGCMPLMGVGVGAGMGAGTAGVGVGAAVSPNDPFRNQPPITQRDVPVACELLDASLHDRGNPNAVNEISQRNGIDLRRATYLMAKFTMGANIINGTVSSAAASRAAANPTPSELEVMRENWPEISRAMGL